MIKSKLASIMLATTLLFSSLTSVQAQSSTCAPRDVVIERLASGYGESRHSMGLGQVRGAGDGIKLVEVFVSKETGTWTITVTLPNDFSCIVAAGEAFEELNESLPTEENEDI